MLQKRRKDKENGKKYDKDMRFTLTKEMKIKVSLNVNQYTYKHNSKKNPTGEMCKLCNNLVGYILLPSFSSNTVVVS